MRQTLALLLTGTLSLTLLTGCNQKEEAPVYVPKAIVVDTMTVEKTDEPRWISVLGRAESGEAVEVRSQVKGILKKSLRAEGSEVRRGDALYEIDPAPFRANLDLARAERRSAAVRAEQTARELARASKLLKSGAVSQQVYDNALSEAEAARAKLAEKKAAETDAAIRLGWTRIEAPADGFIGKNLLNPGALVSAETTLLNTVTAPDDLRIAFSASERTLDGARITTQNRVYVTDERGNRYDARLDFVAADVAAESGTRLMRVKLVGKTDLAPGDFARITLMTDVRKGVYRLPQKLIRQLPDGSYGIFVIVDGKALQRIVEVDRWDGPDWIVTKGLEPDDQIITTHLVRVREGTLVKTAKAP